MDAAENKIKLEQISALDWLKIAAVLLGAAFILYRCLLPFRAEYAFREAFNYEAQRNTPRAIEKYLKVLKLAPWETYYHSQLARIYETDARDETDRDLKLAKIKKAEEIYDLCLKISPTNPWYVVRKAEIYGLYASVETDPERAGELKRRREELIIAAGALDPNNAIFQLNVANLYLDKGEYARALEKYEHVLTIDERLGDAYMMQAELYRRQGDTERQMERYETLIAKAPAYKNARTELGLLYESQGRLKDAIDLYKEEVRLDKNNERAFRVLGYAFYRSEQWANMEIAFNRLTIINPNNADYYVFKAQAQARQNKLPEAVASLEAAQILRPDDATIRNNLSSLRGLIK